MYVSILTTLCIGKAIHQLSAYLKLVEIIKEKFWQQITLFVLQLYVAAQDICGLIKDTNIFILVFNDPSSDT